MGTIMGFPAGHEVDAALTELRGALKRLRRKKGEPSYRDIARATNHAISHQTVMIVIRCDRLPKWGQLEVLVEALGGDIDTFQQLWIAVRDAQDAARAAELEPTKSDRAEERRGTSRRVALADDSEVQEHSDATPDNTAPAIAAQLEELAAQIAVSTTRPVAAIPVEAIELAHHEAGWFSYDFTADDTRLITTDGSGTTCLWDTRSGDLVAKLTGAGTNPLVLCAPHTPRLITASRKNGMISLWDTNSGIPVIKPVAGWNGGVRSVRFSPHGRLLAAAAGGRIQILDQITGDQSDGISAGQLDRSSTLAFSPDGKRLTIGPFGPNAIQLWDTATFEQVSELAIHGEFRDLVFSPDSTRIATSYTDGTARLWSCADGTPIATLSGHRRALRTNKFSPDSVLFATSGDSDEIVQLWYAESGASVGPPLRGHSGPVFPVYFSSTSKRLLANVPKDGRVWLWDTTTCTPVGSPLPGRRSLLDVAVFSPDGDAVATFFTPDGTKGRVQLWDAKSADAIGAPLFSHEATQMSFTTDWRLVASSTRDGKLLMVDLTERAQDRITRAQEAFTGRGKLGPIRFSYNGTVLAFSDNKVMWLVRIADEMPTSKNTAELRREVLQLRRRNRTLIADIEQVRARLLSLTQTLITKDPRKAEA